MAILAYAVQVRELLYVWSDGYVGPYRYTTPHRETEEVKLVGTTLSDWETIEIFETEEEAYAYAIRLVSKRIYPDVRVVPLFAADLPLNLDMGH